MRFTFDGTSATITKDAASTVEVKVPAGAKKGKIIAVTPGDLPRAQ